MWAIIEYSVRVLRNGEDITLDGFRLEKCESTDKLLERIRDENSEQKRRFRETQQLSFEQSGSQETLRCTSKRVAAVYLCPQLAENHFRRLRQLPELALGSEEMLWILAEMGHGCPADCAHEY